MTRSLAALAAALLLACPAGAADGKKLIIRWHGQSFFEVQSSAGTRIVFDPTSIEAFGRHPVERADLICISHLHDDHTQLYMVENARPEAKGPPRILWGLKENRDPNRADWNKIDEKFKDVHVRTVGVYHDEMQGMMRGKNAVFILEVDGLRIVHLGDLGHLLTKAQVKQIGPVDVLMIPVGGVYTINGSEAKKVVEQLKPRRYILPMHYGTKGYDNLLPPDEFLEDQKYEQPRGNELVIDPGAASPAQPIIVKLGWEKAK